MSNKTRVLNVRVVGFSAPERQMLNSIFLLSVAPARQIGYKLWNPETGTAPDMYLLDGDSDSAVASWQATFASTSDRTLVVGAKNTDLGVASAARPLGLKVVGAMDRLAIALNNAAKEAVAHDVSAPRAAGTLPTSPGVAETTPPSLPKADATLTRATGITVKQPMPPPALAASMNATLSSAQAGATAAAAAGGLAPSQVAAAASALTGTMPTSMTSAAPATNVLPQVTLQPNVAPAFDKTLNEKPVTEKTVDRILSDKPLEKADVSAPGPAPSLPPTSGATPLSPAALAAVVAPTRPNLRVVQMPAAAPVSPLAASLPSAAATVTARIADAPLSPPPTAPATPVAPVAPVAAAPTVPVAPVSVPTPRHEEQVFRVLAVDDSPLMRTFLQNKLQPYGIVPEFAASGEEALFKISKNHFDMIFLDVMLPGMDGYDVCKMIKKNKDNSLMKVVMLTSKDKTFDKIRGTMAGCDGYLTKPVDEMKLRAIIERHTVTRK
jgi:CheY-like chemotaxis protein